MAEQAYREAPTMTVGGRNIAGSTRSTPGGFGGAMFGMQRELDRLKLSQEKKKIKQQNQIFDLILGGPESSGGLMDSLLGNLSGGGMGGMTPGTGVLPRGAQAGGGISLGGAGGAGTLATAAVTYGGGQRAALDERFDTAGQNALGNLEMRGLGGSSLVGPALGAVERQRNLASGELEDRLFREQLQFRAAERAPLFGLLGQLLGGLGV